MSSLREESLFKTGLSISRSDLYPERFLFLSFFFSLIYPQFFSCYRKFPNLAELSFQHQGLYMGIIPIRDLYSTPVILI
jgi:hypothetical protein